MPPPPPAEAPISAQMLNGASTPITDDHDDRFGVPTLEELGNFGRTIYTSLLILTFQEFNINV